MTVSAGRPSRSARRLAVWLGSAVLALAVLAGAAVLLWRPGTRPPPPWAAAADRALAESFRTEAPDRAAYDLLFRYLVSGFVHYREPDHASVRFPGERSRHGSVVDRQEAFARMAALMAAWLAGGGADRVTLFDGSEVSLVDMLVEGLAAATTPGSAAYWGHPTDFDQRVVNSEDIARAVWMARDTVWPRLRPEQRANLIGWLAEAARADTYDNNWRLMPLVAGVVAHALDPAAKVAVPLANYRRVQSFQTPEGWYRDGVLGHWHEGYVDYYNAWGFYYDLFWVDQVDPDVDRARIRADLVRFARQFVHLITPRGFPIMGRSICYRISVPAPLVEAALVDPAGFDPGLARRALDAVWSHFIQRGALQGGVITQGYYGTDLRLLDNYSGPGSCYMSTRSLVVAFMQKPDAPLWRDSPSARLPVEQGDFVLDIPSAGWTVQGWKATGEVRITQRNVPDGTPPHLLSRAEEQLSLHDRIEELLGRPYRPDNYPAKYDRRSYSSAIPDSPFPD